MLSRGAHATAATAPAASAGPAAVLEPFVEQWAVLLTTQKRDGTRVGTPVNIAVDGERAYFGTPANTAKVKRLRNHPDVEIAPCTARGKRTAPGLRARARLLDGEEAAAANRRLRRKYRVVHGVLVPLELRIKRTHGLYYELTEVGSRARHDGPAR